MNFASCNGSQKIDAKLDINVLRTTIN